MNAENEGLELERVSIRHLDRTRPTLSGAGYLPNVYQVRESGCGGKLLHQHQNYQPGKYGVGVSLKTVD